MQLFPLTSTFQRILRVTLQCHWPLPASAHLGQIHLSPQTCVQGVEVYLNLVLPILTLPNLVCSRYLLIYLNNICFSLPAFPLFRTWLCSSDSHHGCCACGDQKSAMNSSCASSDSCTFSAESCLGTMEKTIWVPVLFSSAPQAC